MIASKFRIQYPTVTTEAMITDPVYEGKSMQGMIDLVRTGELHERVVLEAPAWSWTVIAMI